MKSLKKRLMKHSLGLTFFLLVCSTNIYSQINLVVNNGGTAYKIIVAANNIESFKAAKSLSTYINKMSGVNIPVSNDNAQPHQKEILIGNNSHIEALHLNIDPHQFKRGECIIRTFGNTILLTGKRDSDIANCVYYFMEKYLGCKAFSSDVIIVPKTRAIELASVNENYSPPFNYRDLYYNDAYDSDYTKLNRIDHFDAGGQNRKWGEIWSSSFMYVIPVNTYFKSHPEYFALNEKGERIPDQLDLTNENLFNEYVKNFRELMKRFPNSKIWSVAANDAVQPNYCHCANCEAINKKEGTPMGTLLNFVNKIAAQFPDKIIATQAYRFYEEPPKTIRPVSNVLIVECGSIELNHATPYQTATDVATQTYRRRLQAWTSVTPNIRVWDYVTDFPYLMCPFPNFQVLQKNLQYYANLGIKNIFMQGDINKGGEFAELRAYVLAKLLWNPNINVNAAMNDFLNSYYGNAAPFMRRYINTTTDALLKSNIPLTSQDHPHKHFKGFLSPERLVLYNKIFDNAESAVANNPEQLERVKVARLPLIYAMLEISKMVNIANKKQNVTASVGYTSSKNILDLLNYFVTMCNKHGIVKMAEYPTTVSSFQADFTKFVNNNFNPTQ